MGKRYFWASCYNLCLGLICFYLHFFKNKHNAGITAWPEETKNAKYKGTTGKEEGKGGRKVVSKTLSLWLKSEDNDEG
jgi:hypothetical protein